MTPKRVVVTGLGLVTPLGVGVNHNWTSLLYGKSGIISVKNLSEKFQNLPCTIAGVVPDKPSSESSNTCEHNLFDIETVLKRGEAKQVSRGIALALKATAEAWEDASFGENSYNRDRIGVAVGMGMVDLDDVHNTGSLLDAGKYSKISPYFVPRILTNMSAGNISIRYGLRGPNHSVSTACTTGAHAIGDAFNFIRWGIADAMICGSAESCVSPIALAGFSRCRALATKFNGTPQEASRPFDELRDGFVMGEGAGIIVLESLEHAKSRGTKRIYGEILGYGLSGDGYHMTSPDQEGTGARLSMERALFDSKISSTKVGYVNAHATSTPLGDKVESKAIEKVIGRTNVSSTKGSIGHLLGAAGSVEAIYTILALSKGVLPMNLNLHKSDLECGLHFVKDQPIEWDYSERIALTNSFGFGGTNATLCFRNFVV